MLSISSRGIVSTILQCSLSFGPARDCHSECVSVRKLFEVLDDFERTRIWNAEYEVKLFQFNEIAEKKIFSFNLD